MPEALEMMHGIADGAASELAASAFADELGHFQKILMINSYFGLMGKPPTSADAGLSRPGGRGAYLQRRGRPRRPPRATGRRST